MAAGPATRISDLIVPEIFTEYAQVLTEEKSRIVQSGILSRNARLDELLAGGGLTFNVPSFRDLDNDEERTSTDTSVPFSATNYASLPAGQALPPDPNKIGTLQEVAVRMNRNNSWSATDLAKVLAGADPMEAIMARVAAYWARRMQAAFVATFNGVIADNIANDSGDFVNDLSGSAFVEGVTSFTAEGFLDTAQTMGDSQDDLTGVLMHSVVYNRAQKNNLIDFIPDARGEIQIPTFLGREVVVDDGMPRTGNVYDSWLFGPGAGQMGMGTPDQATEMDRKPGAGNGGGQDVLYNRVEWCIHPEGFAYQGTPPNGGPSNTQLAGAAQWDRVYPERKQIKFAVMRTREA